MNYYIVIPAHNEEKFISLTLDSLLQQTLLPKKVVIVNDNSTDSTEAIIDSYASKNDWIQKINKVSSGEHLPGSKVVNAFLTGYAALDEHYDFIVKLDADLILPPNYFEGVAAIFKEHPKTGIAGGFAYEETTNGNWELNHPMNKDHVRGAFKAYSKACYTAIGGLKSSMGWDTVDELLARCHGFDIYTDPDLKVKHLRPTGKSYNKKARYAQGEAMYKMRYGRTITFIAALKMALKQKKPAAFFHCLRGYAISAKRKDTPIVTPEEGAFIRQYRMQGIFGKLFGKK
ncbi:glycosyltransferase [Leptobacterium flavescens]|uniref:Glycosyltransferase n=1 Tax=Leptobacterium flavescens TaxID=472055 RepID=A0A6P0UXE2_9FLAO|nr:glycosyltransferase family 2 protein [Leptobacterium flavescens]NER15126.1 glycosyltransferase [Leptobacterium flavescens]